MHPARTPAAWILTGAKTPERAVLEHLLGTTPALQQRPQRRRQIIIADKGYYGRDFEAGLADAEIDLLRPARKGEKPRPGNGSSRPLRQIIESVNDTEGQLDLEGRGGRTKAGVAAVVAQRIVALTAAIWHNHQANALARRSLIAYDH